jgi:hypothetical protein
MDRSLLFLIQLADSSLCGTTRVSVFVAPGQGRGTVDSSICPPEGGRYREQNPVAAQTPQISPVSAACKDARNRISILRGNEAKR